MTSLNKIITLPAEKAGYIVLLDPDKITAPEAAKKAAFCADAGADALFVGGSLMFRNDFDLWVETVKQAISIPLILFPGGGYQLSSHADAVLFMSLISGRNPQYLIGEQVIAAPRIKASGLKTISTAYMLIESGNTTSVGFMSDTQPIPREKADIAAAHALAAEYLGMSLIYLEGGSGAAQSVPEKIIKTVKTISSLPIITGGGIRSPEAAAAKVAAGASFVVTGTVHEEDSSLNLIKEFSDAVHQRSS